MIRAFIPAASAAALAVLAVGVASGAGDAKRATEKVHLGDHGSIAQVYYDPHKLTIHKRDRVSWIWDSDSTLLHSVYLYKSPQGVKKGDFRSGIRQYPTDDFKARFKVPGTYKFLCQVHTGSMRMTVTVKK